MHPTNDPVNDRIGPLERADRAEASYRAGRAERLDAVAELVRTKAWQGHGAGDLATFLAARWRLSKRSARRLVREAETLAERPALGEALSAGAISDDECRALTTLSEEGTDGAQVWLEALEHWTLPELEREARKKVARELERSDDGVWLRMEHTPDERFVAGRFQLHPEDGAVVMAAIDALVPSDTRLREYDHAAAGALVTLAKGAATPARRPTVLLSVAADVLASGEGDQEVSCLSSGGFVGLETARRFACDASVQVLYKDDRGHTTATGRAAPNIPPAVRRSVLERDGGMCVFGGCEMDAFLECHHILPRAQGGPPVPSNLVTTWRHHKLIHEGGWSLRGEAGPRITWVRPDGTPFEPRVRVVLDTC